MRTLINRLKAWLQEKIRRMQAQYCGWCDGWGKQFIGLTPEHIGDASCVPCKGSGRVIEEDWPRCPECGGWMMETWFGSSDVAIYCLRCDETTPAK